MSTLLNVQYVECPNVECPNVEYPYVPESIFLSSLIHNVFYQTHVHMGPIIEKETPGLVSTHGSV